MASDPTLPDSISSHAASPGANTWWARLAQWNPTVLTVAVLALATGLRMALTPLWGSEFTFITYYPAIMFIAVANGWRHGAGATLISAALSAGLFLDLGSLPRVQGTAVTVFIALNMFIVLLSEAVRRARLRALAETSLARAAEHHLRREMQARIEAEAALRTSERHMQFVTDHAPVLIAECGEDCRYRYVNQQYAELFNRTQEDLIGRHPQEVLGEAAYEQAAPFMKEALLGRQVKFDQKVPGIAPAERLLQVTYKPEFNDGGGVVGFITAIVDITERKQAEQARATLAAIVESSDDAIIGKDLNGVITSWNRGAEGLFGYTAQEAVGQSVTMLIPPDRLDEEPPILEQIRRGRAIQHYETVRQRKDGKLLNISLTVSPIRNGQGQIVGVSKVAHDITERVMAEEALRESEERLRLFIEHAPAAIAMFDQHMRYLAVSRRWLADYGLQGDILGQSHYEVFPEIPERWRAAHQQSLAGLVSRAEEDRFDRSDGTVQWLRWEIRPWQDNLGGIGGIIIFTEEITASKDAEAALRESEARYRATFDNAAVGIAHVGLDGRWLRFNDATCAITGYSREELMTKTFADITHPDDVDADWSEVRRLLAGETDTFSMEKRYIRRDGSLIWINLTASLQRDAQGRAQNFISIIQDIQSRKEAQAQLLQLADDLERGVIARTKELAVSQDKLRALTTDLHLAEHRVRQKLATDLHDYLAQLLVLSRIKLGQAKLEDVAPSVAQAMTEVQEVMDQALSYTRTLVAELSPPVLNEFGLPMALKWLAEQMQQQGLTVSLDLETRNLPLPEEQSVLLFQSVRELLMNIVKHAATTEASIAVAQADEILRITVSDQGAGYDVAAAETNLKPGFGLFSIRERMKALGGGFELQSTPGEGTMATLLLPLVHPTLPSVGSTNEPGSNSEGADGSLDMAELASPLVPQTHMLLQPPLVRVLLVDDHLMLRQGLRTVVNSHPRLEVVGEAGDGLEAIDHARMLKPDVVVMDVNMPRCDGITATQRIKEEFPKIRIVALSMHNSPDMMERMKQAGASHYLTKESAAGQLCRAIVDAMSSGD